MLNPFDDHPAQRRSKQALTAFFLLAANAGAWLWALHAFAGRPLLMGAAALAYMLGLRHAFDADHIAAIDNVVRKLRQEGKYPFSTGFFFSLGHSTVVAVAALLVAMAVAAFSRSLPVIESFGGMAGTAVSTAFLLAIGIANLAILLRIRRDGPGQQRGEVAGGFGLLARLFASVFRVVGRSWHMYAIGFLFGLGFDTATEVSLLGVSASQAAHHMAPVNTLVFPALFAAGMSLLDTADSALMTGAYDWAFVMPARKRWYNLYMTAASAGFALAIGGAEGLDLIARQYGLGHLLRRGFDAHFTEIGCAVTALFAASWLVAFCAMRLKERRAMQRAA